MRKIVLTENQIKFVLDSMLEEQVGFEKQDNVNVIISTKDPRHSNFFSTKDLGYMVKRAGLRWNQNTKTIIPDKDMDKEFNKGLLLAGFGSFWWGFFGVLYFKESTTLMLSLLNNSPLLIRFS